ncbi:MAG: ABC transporter permease [Oligoflexales bacterium]
MKIFNAQQLRQAGLFSDPRFVFGSLVVLGTLFCALTAPWLSPYDLDYTEITDRLCPPGPGHWLGCDQNGGDVLSAMLYGARSSLYVSFLAVVLQLTVGVSIGVISGYFGKITDHLLMRAVDIIMAFPGILLALTLTALLGPSLNTIIFSITATGWTSSARIVRNQVISIKEREFVTATRALGASDSRLIFKHILPMTVSSLIIHGTFSLSGVIIVESALSFLGLGAQNAALTWGSLLGQGSQVELDQAPHLTIIPGLAIFLIILAFNFMGDALRDALDPRTQK